MEELERRVMRYARERLSERRFAHVERVVETIETIAEQRGISRADCATLGWLHDAAKEEPATKFRELVRTGEIEIDEETLEQKPLWHGFHAAYLGKNEFGIESEGLLEAVRFHPTGAPGLDDAGVALFVADYAEPGRPMDWTAEIRERANRDLYGAALRVVTEKIGYIVKKGKTPHSRSLAFKGWIENR